MNFAYGISRCKEESRFPTEPGVDFVSTRRSQSLVLPRKAGAGIHFPLRPDSFSIFAPVSLSTFHRLRRHYTPLLSICSNNPDTKIDRSFGIILRKANGGNREEWETNCKHFELQPCLVCHAHADAPWKYISFQFRRNHAGKCVFRITLIIMSN